MSYTNIFGGYNINTAFPSYKSYTFSTNLSLTWASSFVDNTNVTAQINDLNATAINLSVTLADAKLISVGQTIQFNNVGANAIEIHDFTGGLIATIPPTNNNQFILYLRDNTTQAGIWGITHLGAGTSSADANQLAGLGTIPLNSTINTNFVGKQINGNYQVVLNDRANILVSIGGALTVTLPSVVSLPGVGGFYIAINNQGAGTVTVTTPDAKTIDGAASFSINPGQSCYFINVLGGSGLNWNSLGYGTPTYFQVRVQSTDLAPHSGSTVTLTAQQSLPLVQNFTGALTGNVTVFFPSAAGQWYINNLTSGAFLVRVQLAGPLGSTVTVPQGERLIVYSDGTSMFSTPTITANATFPDGSVGAPGIAFASDTSTGFFKLPNGVVGFSSLGSKTLEFSGTSSNNALSIYSGNNLVWYDVNNINYQGFAPSSLASSNIVWILPTQGASAGGQILYSDTSDQLEFTEVTYPITIGANRLLYSSSPNTVTGLASGNNSILTSDATGIPAWLLKSISIPAAFVRFNGTTGAISNGYNVASVTVNSTGNYTINFTTPLSTSSYLQEITCQSNTFAVGQGTGTQSTSSFVVQTYTANGTAFSPSRVNIVVVGAS